MKYDLPLTRWQLLIISFLVIGIFFRFLYLDRKVYWYDEVFTSLRIFGYTEAEVIQQVSRHPVVSVEDLQRYQHDAGRNLLDTIKSLATEDFQHPPLYYAIAHFWVKWLGDSIAAIRGLSALISVLVFPSIYWLCRELFPSPSVAWVSMALVAVSPFHVLMAQEARQYSLWTVIILLSSASVLRAIRLSSKLSWRLYAISLIVGLYTFLFTGLVAIAHGLYLFSLKTSQFSKAFSAYFIASLTAIAAFIPWLVIVVSNFSEINSNVNKDEAVPLISLAKTWVFNLSYIFFDVWGQSSLESRLDLAHFIILPFLLLTGYSLYFLYRTTTKQVSLFILLSIVVPTIPLILPDLILGGQRSLTMRYLIPTYLGIQIAVAYLLATKLSSSSVKQQKFWRLLTLVLLTSGILSCVVSARTETWWTKGNSAENPQVAQIINQANRPLVISDTKIGRIISLSYLLEPKVQFQLNPKCHTCQLDFTSNLSFDSEISTNYSDIFAYKPSEEMLNKFNQIQNCTTKLVYEPARLWRLSQDQSISLN
ncbi:glycosyltransferase family 39 protein [Chroococcidiopsis sp. FACHB-1243]|uniref:glycosyltransferase family 39 protein n=1 Tax=Chroococcidiopsis sp. [FACHB-1243] TaxID=2692781 RepID=UPI00177F600E|nr:glycosyltransferase family 39 protein [Chroococcidiopsis sp. [FACHB-1243]]MBD2304973.1 glycosyltransferase family 39 protein [Chroococcidiopsis sp. [FACHB-1243]]